MPGADHWLAETTTTLVDSALDAVRAGAKAPIEADWLRVRYAGMEVLALTVLAGAFLVVVAGAAVRHDGRAMVRAALWAVVTVPAMTLGLGLLHSAVGIGDELAAPAAARVEQQAPTLKQRLQPTGVTSGAPAPAPGAAPTVPGASAGPGVVAVPRVVLAGAALMVLLQALPRDAALSAAALAAPVAFVAGLWPAARPLATRVAGVVTALLLSRFVMLTVLDVGLAQLASAPAGDPLRDNLAVTVVFVLTAVAPWLLARGTPALVGVLSATRVGSVAAAPAGADDDSLRLGSLGPAVASADGAAVAPAESLEVLRPGGELR